jgi:hypothetical protein
VQQQAILERVYLEVDPQLKWLVEVLHPPPGLRVEDLPIHRLKLRPHELRIGIPERLTMRGPRGETAQAVRGCVGVRDPEVGVHAEDRIREQFEDRKEIGSRRRHARVRGVEMRWETGRNWRYGIRGHVPKGAVASNGRSCEAPCSI